MQTLRIRVQASAERLHSTSNLSHGAQSFLNLRTADPSWLLTAASPSPRSANFVSDHHNKLPPSSMSDARHHGSIECTLARRKLKEEEFSSLMNIRGLIYWYDVRRRDADEYTFWSFRSKAVRGDIGVSEEEWHVVLMV